MTLRIQSKNNTLSTQKNDGAKHTNKTAADDVNMPKCYWTLSDVHKKLNELNDVLQNPLATEKDKKAAKAAMKLIEQQCKETSKKIGSYELRAAKANGDPKTPAIDFILIGAENPDNKKNNVKIPYRAE